jgi:hypothetical protein
VSEQIELKCHRLIIGEEPPWRNDLRTFARGRGSFRAAA